MKVGAIGRADGSAAAKRAGCRRRVIETFCCPLGSGRGSPFQPPFDGRANWRNDRTCSYCGSIDPNRFIALIEEGATLIPTDKNYKVYVRRDGEPDGKFYFEHLPDGLRDRFIDLLNERRIAIGFPGHFYVMPYFLARTEAAS